MARLLTQIAPVPLEAIAYGTTRFRRRFMGDAMAKGHHVALGFCFLVIGLIAGLLGFTVSRALRSDREVSVLPVVAMFVLFVILGLTSIAASRRTVEGCSNFLRATQRVAIPKAKQHRENRDADRHDTGTIRQLGDGHVNISARPKASGTKPRSRGAIPMR